MSISREIPARPLAAEVELEPIDDEQLRTQWQPLLAQLFRPRRAPAGTSAPDDTGDVYPGPTCP